ncbi:MAG: hypothetical protein JJU12_06830 [Chlamydiales bacterium]|nr:hypothetical protein [Chlamydiales bacterium]
MIGQSRGFHAGQNVNFSTDSAIIGFRGIKSFGCLNLFLNIEASFDSASGNRVVGQGGVGWNF